MKWPDSTDSEQVGFAGKLMNHPNYDEFWQDQALDKILAKLGVTVPTMLVHSLWDQEDIYGNMALYKALEGTAQPETPESIPGDGTRGIHHQQSASMAARVGADPLRQRHRGVFSRGTCCGRSSITT